MENDFSDRKMTAAQAQATITSIADDQSKVTAFVPWWYYLVLGCMHAALVLVQDLNSTTSMTFIACFVVLGSSALTRWHSRKYGIVLQSPAGRRSKAIVAALVVVLVLTVAIAFFAKRQGLPLWVTVLSAAISFITIVVLGPWYERVSAQETRESMS